MSPKRRKATYPYRVSTERMGVSAITVTEEILPQKRFFCANCQREVFLLAKYCDKCGGEIEWPEEIKKAISSWKPQGKKR